MFKSWNGWILVLSEILLNMALSEIRDCFLHPRLSTTSTGHFLLQRSFWRLWFRVEASSRNGLVLTNLCELFLWCKLVVLALEKTASFFDWAFRIDNNEFVSVRLVNYVNCNLLSFFLSCSNFFLSSIWLHPLKCRRILFNLELLFLFSCFSLSFPSLLLVGLLLFSAAFIISFLFLLQFFQVFL